MRPERVQSLTLIEPPAFNLVGGNTAADTLVAGLEKHWKESNREPREFLGGFWSTVAGQPIEPPDPLPLDLQRGAELLLVQRFPWQGEHPLVALREAGFPVLVIFSGDHHPAFHAVCAHLVTELRAEHQVIGIGQKAKRIRFDWDMNRFS